MGFRAIFANVSRSSSAINNVYAEVMAKKRCEKGIKSCNNFIAARLKTAFYRFGLTVATHPFLTIGLSVLLAIGLSFGFFWWREEARRDRLWLPYSSPTRKDVDWVIENWPNKLHLQTVIVTADNVLTPDVFKIILDIDKKVRSIQVGNDSLETLCARDWTAMNNKRSDDYLALLFTNQSHLQQQIMDYLARTTTTTEEPLTASEESSTEKNSKERINSQERKNNSSERKKNKGKNSKNCKNKDPSHPAKCANHGKGKKGGKMPTLNSSSSPMDLMNTLASFATLDPQTLLQLASSFDGSVSPPSFLANSGLMPPASTDAEGMSSCIIRNLLSMWRFNETIINSLNETDILKAVNSPQTTISSSSFIAPLMGKTKTNEYGDIISAGAMLLVWIMQESGNDTIQQENKIFDWEKQFINVINELKEEMKEKSIDIYPLASRSVEDGMVEALTSNVFLLASGYALVLLYISTMLGRFNKVQHRFYLSLMGVISVGFAVLSSNGLCAIFGIFSGPVNLVLPFLLIGLGVDNMFVMVEALNSLPENQRCCSMPERIGFCLQHAGVSITITSFTDFAAFAIGALTVIPAMRSFCLYAAIGILCVLLYQVTFFAACLSLDEQRIQSFRHGFLPCITLSDWKPSPCSQKELLRRFYDKFYTPFLNFTVVKIAVILITAVFFTGGVWGICNLKYHFDPVIYFRKEAYQYEFLTISDQYFPKGGVKGNIFLGNISYFEEKEILNQLHDQLASNPYINNGSVISWYHSFQQWNPGANYSKSKEFYQSLRSFLLSNGQKFLKDIVFSGNILDPREQFNITVSQFQFEHIIMNSLEDEIEAMKQIRDIIKNVTCTMGEQTVIVYCPEYLVWETNKALSEELFLNLGLTMVAVVIVTTIFLIDLRAILMVFTCICFTLVDIAGMYYYWGLHIESVTTICMILAVGLAVDYAAHVGHTFMSSAGTKKDRIERTLSVMGPAILHGGISTLLAFVLVAGSDLYIYATFFKVFLGVVGFGLFHGLAYLPVMLSLFGPKPYSLPEENKPTETEEKNAEPLLVIPAAWTTTSGKDNSCTSGLLKINGDVKGSVV